MVPGSEGLRTGMDGASPSERGGRDRRTRQGRSVRPCLDSSSGVPRQMKRFRYEEMRALLPELEELRPLRDLALRGSDADPERAWATSGELSTVGDRIVDVDRLAEASGALADRTRDHLATLYDAVCQALQKAAAGDGPAAALALLDAGALEEARDRHDRAIAYAMAAARAVEGERDRGVAALALRRWGRAARARGALGEALRRYSQSHEIAAAIGDLPAAGESAIGAGNVLEQWGRWSEAEVWYRRALAFLERLPDPTPGRWHACLNLHITLRRRGDVEESRPWLDRAEELAELLQDRGAVPFTENARGQLCMALEDFEAAGRHFDAALSAAGNAHARVTIRLNLAESLHARGRTLDAAEQARAAEAEAIAGGAEVKLPEVYRMLGRFASADGQADAFVLFERSLELAGVGTGQELEAAQTYQAYAEAEAALGHTDNAGAFQARAEGGYRALGIRGMRRRWVDCFDVLFPTPPSPEGVRTSPPEVGHGNLSPPHGHAATRDERETTRSDPDPPSDDGPPSDADHGNEST